MAQDSPMTQFGHNLMGNPLLNIGLGILGGSHGSYGSFGQQLAQGASQGIIQANRAAEWQQRRAMQAQEMKQQQLAAQREAQRRAAQQQIISQLPQNQQTIAQAYPQQFAQSLFPKPTKLSDFDKKMALVGGDPAKYRQHFGSQGATVNVGDKMRSAADQAALDYTKSYTKNVNQNAIDARGAVEVARRNQQLLKQANKAGVTGSGLKDIYGKMASWAGLPDGASYQQIDTAYKNKALDNLTKMKGSLSDRELAFATAASEGTEKSSETNYILTEVGRRAAIRNQDKARKYSQFLKENNGQSYGFDQWYFDNHDPFGEFDLQQIKDQFRREVEDVPQSQIDKERDMRNASRKTVESMYSKSGGM